MSNINILDALELVSNKNKLKPCTRCGSLDYEVRYAMNKDGRDCYPYFCIVCNTRSPIVESKSVAKTLGFKV